MHSHHPISYPLAGVDMEASVIWIITFIFLSLFVIAGVRERIQKPNKR